ncbi:AAA family ATPase [Tuberibacillus sp. Marseille-P3662]|uniref:AAA family ATPase n=1 Tax=Tuberibacillus sp. Marseille-P3662 TaxID=1965358 RepID=UPI000A1CE1A4|nr:AAA family ATPase [Tuberibacillus sp. Marseille-P3662]
MLLESITLQNFRQYYQKQTINFSQSTTRNVTVIHGENGSGKTALLHAFLWCLYGDLNLPNSEKICNDHSIEAKDPGEEIEASVTLKFQNNNKKYTLKRCIVVKKIDEESNVHYYEPNVSLEYQTEEGQSETIENPSFEINQILPKDLRSYFFFDGERIDNLSKDDGSEDIKKAIKNMMGLEILERSITHTDEARKRFRSEMQEYGDPETKQIMAEHEKLENEKQEEHKKKSWQEKNLETIDQQIRKVEERLTQIEEAKHLQEQREQKRDEKDNISGELQQIKKDLNNQISKLGHLAFTVPLLESAHSALNNSDNNNRVSGIKANFIDKLIENNQCICGDTLEEGSSHIEHLKKLKSLTTTNQVENSIDEFKQYSTVIHERRRNLFKELQNLKQTELQKQNELKKLNDEIEEISAQLTDKNSEEIVDLENKRKNLRDQKRDIDRKIGAIEGKVTEIENKILENRQEQKKLNAIASKSKVAQVRMKTCEDVMSAMKDILSIRESNVKEQLQERIAKVYSQFLRKDYQVKLSDTYELNVVNENDNSVAMSQGERQITSLSFIGAIVDIARETYNKENKSAFDEGGIYPLVMDSPFGALDSDHQERVAKGIYHLADQVIVIVSTSQWQREVADQMGDLIGKEYQLAYNDPRYNKERPYEFTEVKEVK